MIKIIYLAHIFACFFMTGLIWLIQVIHYPSFRYINQEHFSTFHRLHTNRITFIVGPLMTLEFATGAYLFFQENMSLWSSINLAGILVIWLSTAFLSVPAHNKLALSYGDATLQRLISTNWIRTIMWTLRAILLVYLLAKTSVLF